MLSRFLFSDGPRPSSLFLPLALSLLLLVSACATSGSPSSSSTDGPAPDAAAGMALPPDYDFPDRDTVRVATWNVENFVDAYDDPYVDADRENNPGDDVDRDTRHFAEAVDAMNADILVLQEIESEAFARRIVEDHLPDAGYEFFASTKSPDWFQNVVLVSRYPLGVLHGFADVVTPIEGIRAENGEPDATSLINNRLWMVDVRVTSTEMMTVVGAHLKAGGDDRDRAWRIGQIRFLHTALHRFLQQRPGADLLVAGDLNSLSDSPELRLLLNHPDRPAPDSLTTGTAGGIRSAVFSDPLSGTPSPTHPSDDPTRQLDYLLPNRTLRADLVDGSMRVARPLPPETLTSLTDHLPVVATFATDDTDAGS